MEMVFVLLVVVILVVLPIALFLLAIGDLAYCTYKAIIGDKKEVEHPTRAPSFHAR